LRIKVSAKLGFWDNPSETNQRLQLGSQPYFFYILVHTEPNTFGSKFDEFENSELKVGPMTPTELDLIGVQSKITYMELVFYKN
jgi:hypothetical protein